jgi:hypothetical protein
LRGSRTIFRKTGGARNRDKGDKRRGGTAKRNTEDDVLGGGTEAKIRKKQKNK